MAAFVTLRRPVTSLTVVPDTMDIIADNIDLYLSQLRTIANRSFRMCPYPPEACAYDEPLGLLILAVL